MREQLPVDDPRHDREQFNIETTATAAHFRRVVRRADAPRATRARGSGPGCQDDKPIDCVIAPPAVAKPGTDRDRGLTIRVRALTDRGGPTVALASSMRLAVTAATLLALAGTAAADLGPMTVGARVGGYGFRNPDRVDGTGHVAWDECRMNGLGVFVRRGVGRFFAEAGADVYFSEAFPLPTSDDGSGDQQDRLSGLLTVAAGANLVQTKHFVGYAQLGVGLEMTQFRFSHGDDTLEDRRALPLGFVGIGGELRLGDRTSLGASLRAHVMGNFDAAYEADRDVWDPMTNHLTVSPEAAAQGQFYVAYAM